MKGSKTSPKKSTDLIEYGMHRDRSRSRLQAKHSDISVALTEMIKNEQKFDGDSKELQLLGIFRGSAVNAITNSLITFLKVESRADDVVILKIYPGEKIKMFSLSQTFENTVISKSLGGILEVLSKKLPKVMDTDLESWQDIFKFVPKVLILLPIPKPKSSSLVTSTTEAIVAFGFSMPRLPKIFIDEPILRVLISAGRLTIPLLVNTQRHLKSQQVFKRIDRASQTVKNCEKEVQDLGTFLNVICFEMQSYFGVDHCVVFARYEDEYDPLILKYCSVGGCRIDTACPLRSCHAVEELQVDATYPAGSSALNKKTVLINDLSDLKKYCDNRGPIHSVGGCIVKNIMCFLIEDASNDMPLLIELSEKTGGFTEADVDEAIMLSRVLSPVLSSAVMLDYRKRAVRRNGITNELLNNIKTVQSKSVKHLLDLKFRYSNSFRKSFFTTRFVFKHITERQYAGVILYMFTDLDLIKRWKIRRATLIRFILSIEQGYRDNPYHNWKHACTVTHFAFIMLKKFDLQKDGYLREIEAFALLVACLCHDVDHRGVNNHFSLCMAESDPYRVYKQEDGLMERHHIAVTLQVLASDDCNIVENLSDHEYKEFIELLQWNILATDISKYLHDQQHLFATLSRFDKSNSDHRKSLLSVLMTMCDLSETVKPWNDYIPTVKSIFAEFFAQGDEELKLGFTPTPIMDRRIAYIPYIEMKFINEIVRPAYQMIAEIIPKSEECLKTIDYYKELWLVSTQVFDANTHVHDPLEILELPKLREEHLKLTTNPELGREASKIRQSLVVASSTLGSLIGIKNLKQEASKGEFDKIEISNGLWAKTKNIFCCLRCRKKALKDAALIRQTNRENEFMEERCDLYEKKRSLDNDTDFKNDGLSTRERLNSIIGNTVRPSIIGTLISGQKLK